MVLSFFRVRGASHLCNEVCQRTTFCSEPLGQYPFCPLIAFRSEMCDHPMLGTGVELWMFAAPFHIFLFHSLRSVCMWCPIYLLSIYLFHILIYRFAFIDFVFNFLIILSWSHLIPASLFPSIFSISQPGRNSVPISRGDYFKKDVKRAEIGDSICFWDASKAQICVFQSHRVYYPKEFKFFSLYKGISLILFCHLFVPYLFSFTFHWILARPHAAYDVETIFKALYDPSKW